MRNLKRELIRAKEVCFLPYIRIVMWCVFGDSILTLWMYPTPHTLYRNWKRFSRPPWLSGNSTRWWIRTMVSWVRLLAQPECPGPREAQTQHVHCSAPSQPLCCGYLTSWDRQQYSVSGEYERGEERRAYLSLHASRIDIVPLSSGSTHPDYRGEDDERSSEIHHLCLCCAMLCCSRWRDPRRHT